MVATRNDLTAAEIARRVRARTLSPVAVVEACLARIAEIESALRAWVHLDTEGALKTARALERSEEHTSELQSQR